MAPDEQTPEQPPAHDPVSFTITEDGNLLAHYVPPEDGERIALDESALVERIRQAGHGEFMLFEDRLGAFLKRMRTSVEPFETVVGGNRDAEVARVDIPADALHAYVEIEPRKGRGRPLLRDDLTKALTGGKVKAGVIDEALAHAAELSGSADGAFCLPVARGRQARHGEDARIEPLFPSVADRRPRIDYRGRADYRELGGIDEVEPETDVVQLVPPTNGEPGMTVTGKKLPARNGKNIAFRPLDNSVEASPERPGVIRSKITGRPVIDGKGVKVEPVLKLGDIDVGTGNVRFSGSVVVKGDVKTGMQVESAGDIQVLGTVEAAELIAGGSVEVKGGLIGHGSVRDDEGHLRGEAAIIRAKGTVSARFAENALVDAGEAVVIQDRIGHCEITAGDEVLVGKGGRSKGQIIGGSTRARQKIEAMILGSAASVQTRVEVGFTGDLREKLQEAEQHLEAQRDRLEQIKQIFERLRKHPAAVPKDKIAKLGKAARQIKEDIDANEVIRDQLQEAKEAAESATILAQREVYNNVTVVIAGVVHTVREDRHSVEFVLDEGDIAYR